MKKSGALFDLIKSLTKSEKRFIKTRSTKYRLSGTSPIYISYVKYFIFLLCVVCIHCYSHAQGSNEPLQKQNLIDSLKEVLKNHQNDISKTNTLNSLSYALERISNYDSALIFAEAAKHLAEKIRFEKGLEEALRNIGVIYCDKGNYSNAIEYQLKSLALSQQLKDKEGIASSMVNIGKIYFKQGNYKDALEYDFKALSIAQQIGAKKIIADIFK
jgi:tetratricopeptide (TPR) repeat protein